ncbi:NAD-dependent dehydratase [Actinocatenispora thailandica]|uniref:NAD-dependent dehydratase n=1 Tax=Actinocatenispora thailandica TaxID=227318 RepID=A0A7R7DUT6_9ACTN|nr:SDR family oxidoreductase [Actinocatenispora thailandica]BCJ38232.1 NAD-dependent dehydratase [Actinocatenispora thailandica]
MRVVVAGGHGKIALRLTRQLVARSDAVVSLIRNPDQADELRELGAEPIVVDLESATAEEVAEQVKYADAVVFAAGAGPGSGIERKRTMDRDGAILLADAARLAGVQRYLLVSSMGAGAPARPGTDPVFAAYQQAKGEAEEELRQRPDLALTIVRPGRLTDDPGTGRVRLAPEAERGEVTRDDVAWVLAALLDEPDTAGLTLELVGGGASIAQAVAAVARTGHGVRPEPNGP